MSTITAEAYSREISAEYDRVLAEYKRALIEGQTAIAKEIKALDENRARGYRHTVRHSLLYLAGNMLRTDAKMAVFNNLVWESKPKP